MLVWSEDEEQAETNFLVMEMIKQFLQSPFVDFEFIIEILEMFIKLETFQIIPALLNTEPYGEIIIVLFNRGEELMNDDEKLKERWTAIMQLLENLIAENAE